MLGRLAHRGPDGAGAWQEGAVAVGHRLLHTTPESLREVQPVVSPDGALVLVADARLDDREGLQAALGRDRAPDGASSDAELLLRAYRAWGADCPARLLGDFAFAVWDARARTLFCARDPLGVRPLHYHRGARLFAFASEIKALFALPDVPRRLDEAMVAHYLLPCVDDPAATFFADVASLPPGHALVVGPGPAPAAPRAYWALDPAREAPLAGDAACAEALRETFGEAVRCRLRSALPLGATLSGGLDSSSVVGTARRLAGPGAPPLPVVSAVFPDLPACDERPYIEAVVRRGGVVPHAVRADRLDPLDGFADPPWHPDETFHAPALFLHWAVQRAAGAAGLRTLLVGTSGDAVVSHGGARVHELVRGGRWRHGAREALGLARAHRLPWRSVALALAGPLVPPGTLRAWRWLRRRGRPPGVPAMSPGLARRVDLADRLREQARRRTPLVRDTRGDHWRRLVGAHLPTVLQTLDAGAAAAGLELRDPFLDRRVVELCLSLPAEQKLRDGQSRGVLRRAMADVLPAEVRDRPGKAEFRPLLAAALRAFGSARLDALLGDEAALAPFVHLPALRAARQRHAAGGRWADAYAVWKAATLALWLARTKLTPT
jgi:asparagine synthase (glutamine-hydrolysing)